MKFYSFLLQLLLEVPSLLFFSPAISKANTINTHKVSMPISKERGTVAMNDTFPSTTFHSPLPGMLNRLRQEKLLRNVSDLYTQHLGPLNTTYNYDLKKNVKPSNDKCPPPGISTYDTLECLSWESFTGTVEEFNQIYGDQTISDTIKDMNGCDSLIEDTIVSRMPGYEVIYDTSEPPVNVCYGSVVEDSYWWYNKDIRITADTTIVHSTGLLQDRCGGGMNYIWFDHFRVVPPYPIIRNIDTVLCEGSKWDSLVLYKDTIVAKAHTYTNIGCDSLITYYKVKILRTDTTTNYVDTSICIGQIYRQLMRYTDTVFRDTLSSISHCGVSENITVTSLHIMENIPFHLGDDTAICLGQQIALIGPAEANKYQWNTGAQSSELTIFQTGEYILKVTASDGCSTEDSIHLSVIKDNPFIFPDDTTICEGDSVQLIASGGLQYTWSPLRFLSCNNCSAPVIIPDTSTLYNLIITGRCSRQQKSINVYVDHPLIEVTTNYKIYKGEEVQLQAAGNGDISWHFDPTLSCTACSDPVASPQVTTTYYAEASEEACSVGAQTTIEVQDGFYFFIPNAFSPNNDGQNDSFKPTTNLLGMYEISIYNRWGELVFHTNSLNEAWDGTWKGNPCPVGSYVYIVRYQEPDKHFKVREGTVTLLR